MEKKSLWHTNNFSANIEIPNILWNPKVHYSVNNSLPFLSLLCQINPLKTKPICFM
jgi:hypothetical protein